LERYAAAREAAAFEVLLRRHGPMVLGVCRRILRNEQDAEDAFQATFLILVRKAASVRSASSVASWLYGVARHTALKARGRRRPTEPLPELTTEDGWQELRSVLDAELAQVHEVYRTALILCDLEGRTIMEAAVLVGCPQGTLASRLRRGRGLLAERLARRGFVLPVGVALASSVPPHLVASTLDAAAAGAVSAPVAALTEGVLRTMSSNKLKAVIAVLMVVGLVTGSVLSFRSHAAAEVTPSPRLAKVEQKKPEDNLKNTILALDKHLWEVGVKGDWQERAKFLADDLVTISILGKYGREENIEASKHVRWAPDWKVEDVEVVRTGKDTAVLCYRYSCKITTNDGTVLEARKDYRIVYVWANRNGGWQIVFCFDDHGRKGTELPLDLHLYLKPRDR
jgi:RNA polymerase sigma factor (sigma-70 family)